MFVRLPLHLTIVTAILKVMKTPMFQVNDMITTKQHPFADLLRGDWQSQAKMFVQKNKLRIK